MHEENDVLTDDELVVVARAFLKKKYRNMHVYTYEMNIHEGLSY